MEIQKERSEQAAGTPAAEELAYINRYAKTPLEAEQVYAFAVRLCDNEVDRDYERFETAGLERLGELFLGRSGIFDHQWSARGQTARIYRTEVVAEPGRITAAGDGYCWLKGWAYLLRTEANGELIAEIEGGIKKEVSVGCSVAESVCSVCGAPAGTCHHVKGEVYDGKLCYASLEGASDAYEFSFVAVPAQPGAGVVKGRGGPLPGLRELAGENPRCALELEQLEEEAGLGRSYLEGLRQEAVRLGLLAGVGLDRAALRGLADKLSPGELSALSKAWERQAGGRYPLQTQLRYGEKAGAEQPDRAFLI